MYHAVTTPAASTAATAQPRVTCLRQTPTTLTEDTRRVQDAFHCKHDRFIHITSERSPSSTSSDGSAHTRPALTGTMPRRVASVTLKPESSEGSSVRLREAVATQQQRAALERHSSGSRVSTGSTSVAQANTSAYEKKPKPSLLGGLMRSGSSKEWTSTASHDSYNHAFQELAQQNGGGPSVRRRSAAPPRPRRKSSFRPGQCILADDEDDVATVPSASEAAQDFRQSKGPAASLPPPGSVRNITGGGWAGLRGAAALGVLKMAATSREAGLASEDVELEEGSAASCRPSLGERPDPKRPAIGNVCGAVNGIPPPSFAAASQRMSSRASSQPGISSIPEESGRQDARFAELEETIEELEQQVAKLEADKAELQQQCGEVLKENQVLMQENETLLKRQIDDLEQNAALIEENEHLKSYVKRLEENDLLKTRLSQLEARGSSSIAQTPVDGPPELPGGPHKTEIRPGPLLLDEIGGPPELPGGPRKTGVLPPPVLPGEDDASELRQNEHGVSVEERRASRRASALVGAKYVASRLSGTVAIHPSEMHRSSGRTTLLDERASEDSSGRRAASSCSSGSSRKISVEKTNGGSLDAILSAGPGGGSPEANRAREAWHAALNKSVSAPIKIRGSITDLDYDKFRNGPSRALVLDASPVDKQHSMKAWRTAIKAARRASLRAADDAADGSKSQPERQSRRTIVSTQRKSSSRGALKRSSLVRDRKSSGDGGGGGTSPLASRRKSSTPSGGIPLQKRVGGKRSLTFASASGLPKWPPGPPDS